MQASSAWLFPPSISEADKMLQGLPRLGALVAASGALRAAGAFTRARKVLPHRFPFWGLYAVIIIAVALLTSANLAAADEMSAILGCGQSGAPCGSITSRYPATYPRSIRAAVLTGERGAAGDPGRLRNVTSIQQNGVHDSATVTQTGSQNGVVGIAQNGSHETATVWQNGANLSVQINQSGTGSSIA